MKDVEGAVALILERAAARHDQIDWSVDRVGSFVTVKARRGMYAAYQTVVAVRQDSETCDSILDDVAQDLMDTIQAELDRKAALRAEADRIRAERARVIVCCDDFAAALEDGTDPEGYSPAISLNLMMGSGGLPPIRFCPWCGARKEIKPVEEKEPE